MGEEVGELQKMTKGNKNDHNSTPYQPKSNGFVKANSFRFIYMKHTSELEYIK